MPRKQRLLMEKHQVQIPTLSVLSPEHQKQLTSYYNAYYASLTDRLQKCVFQTMPHSNHAQS